MPPSDNSLYKTRTAAAKKQAQAKSRKSDVDLHMEQIIAALFPIWPGKWNHWEIAGHFALSMRGLKCSKEEWLLMDLPEFVARTRKWVEGQAVWVAHALYEPPESTRGKPIGDLEQARRSLPKAPGRPIDQETWDTYRRYVEWCRENYAYPHGHIPPGCLMVITEGLHPEWERSSEKRRLSIEQGVRNAIKSARKFLELA